MAKLGMSECWILEPNSSMMYHTGTFSSAVCGKTTILGHVSTHLLCLPPVHPTTAVHLCPLLSLEVPPILITGPGLWKQDPRCRDGRDEFHIQYAEVGRLKELDQEKPAWLSPTESGQGLKPGGGGA